MKSVWLLMLLVALLSLPAAVGAQESEGTTLSAGYMITLPEGWVLAKSGELYNLSQGELLIVVMPPDQVAARFAIEPDSDAAEILIAAYDILLNNVLNPETINVETRGEYTFAFVEFEVGHQNQRGMSVILHLQPGEFSLMEFYAPADQYVVSRSVALDIMLSLRVDENPIQLTGEPCLISTSYAGVELRIGPGNHRAIYHMMALDFKFPVLGQATIDDGSLWWRLSIDSGAAAELWVADSDIEKHGDCVLIETINTPPIVEPDDFTPGPNAPDTHPPAVTPEENLAACIIHNETLYTVKGTLRNATSPSYYFETMAGAYVIVNVPAGQYDAHFFCDGCGGLGTTASWTCEGVTDIYVQPKDVPW